VFAVGVELIVDTGILGLGVGISGVIPDCKVEKRHKSAREIN
jgi:hypothetical protein